MSAGADRGEFSVGDRLGAYSLEEVLGRGQMGTVYRAVSDDGSVVALKVLRSDLAADDLYRRRFIREGDIASEVEGRHVLPVVDRGEADGRPYLASPYVPGGSLADRLEDGPLAVEELARVVAHVGAGLDDLHRLKLVHRDVKPSNVMLDEDGNALVTDFGVARGAAHTVLTREGRIVGTADYLAPEVIRGEPATPVSDVYGLGCLAYECAVGVPPFAHRATIAEICIGHLREEPPDPVERRPDLPGAVARSILTALAKDPGRRPATGAGYGVLLRAAARGS